MMNRRMSLSPCLGGLLLCGACGAPDPAALATTAEALTSPLAVARARRFGGTSADYATALAVDAQRNTVLAGYFQGAVNFGGGVLRSAGQNDIFVAKYGPTGDHLWSRRYGGAGDDRGAAVALDAQGNVLLTGTFQGAVNFGAGTLQSAGGSDAILLKLSPAGVFQWGRALGGTADDRANGVAADSAGNVLVAGHFQGQVNLGGALLRSAGGPDIFLAKYAPTGGHLASRRFGGPLTDTAWGVTVDSQDRVAIAGSFQGRASLGGATFTAAADDGFIARYSPALVHEWSSRFGGAAADGAAAIARDSRDNLYVAGSFQGSFTLGTSALRSAGGSDLLLASYDPSGAPRWARSCGGAGDDIGFAVSLRGGDVLAAGVVQGDAWCAGVPLRSAGGYDVVVADYHEDGAGLEARTYGGTGDDRAFAIAGDAVAGDFTGRASFGGKVLQSAGQTDVFLMHLEGAAPVAGLIGRWHLDGDARDASGNGRDGVIRGATPTAGRTGQAYHFDGGAEIDVGAVPFPAETYTANLWIRTTQPGAYSDYRVALSNLDYGSGTGSLEVCIGDGVQSDFYSSPIYTIWQSGISVVNLYAPSPPADMRDGQWHMLTAVYRPGEQRLYLDGQLRASGTYDGPLPQNGSPLRIGGAEFGPYHHPWIGDIDEVSLYDRALSAAEVAALFTP